MRQREREGRGSWRLTHLTDQVLTDWTVKSTGRSLVASEVVAAAKRSAANVAGELRPLLVHFEVSHQVVDAAEFARAMRAGEEIVAGVGSAFVAGELHGVGKGLLACLATHSDVAGDA